MAVTTVRTQTSSFRPLKIRLQCRLKYYLHGAQLASAFYRFQIEPQRDHHSLKDPGKDIISILCRTFIGDYAIYSYEKDAELLTRNMYTDDQCFHVD